MKWLAAVLAVALILLQYRVWFSEDGVREVERLKRAVATQRSDNEQLAERNRQLAAEVRVLKTGMEALEERARSDLGMIARNETFYQVVPARPADASHPPDRKSTRLNSSHPSISYAVFCLKKTKKMEMREIREWVGKKKEKMGMEI